MNPFAVFQFYFKPNSYVIVGNVDPKPTNLAGSDGVGGAPNCGTVGNEGNTSISGSSMDNPNNHHSNFSPQGNLQNNSSTMNNGGKDTSNSDVQKLQEQLNDIKEQVCNSFCVVYMIYKIKFE